MKITIDRDVKHSLLIDEKSLESLVHFLTSKYRGIEIVAKCVDGSTLETTNLEDIISFDNPNYRKILKLRIGAVNCRRDCCYIETKADTFYRPIDIHVISESNEKAVFVTQEVENKLREMKPWYDYLARYKLSLIIVVIWVTLGLSYTAFQVMWDIPSSNFWAKYSAVDTLNILLLLNLVVLAISYGLDWVQAKLFPRVFFLIGKQKIIMEHIEKMRVWFFNGVLLAIATGVIGNLVSAWLTK